MFEIRGIDTDMMLDPTNGNAFVKGITLDDFTGASGLITQTPITFDTDVTDPNPGPSAVPLPAGLSCLVLRCLQSGALLDGVAVNPQRKR